MATLQEQNKTIVRHFVAMADKNNIEEAATFLAPTAVVHLARAPGLLE